MKMCIRDSPKGMILICPGGGYQWLSPREAQPVAHAFTAAGWAAAVVYYTCLLYTSRCV